VPRAPAGGDTSSGGGFWIGRAALVAVAREYDGRGPRTLLTELVLNEMKLGSPTELIHAVYVRGMHRFAIASIAPIVHRAAAGGDATASEILDRAARELATAAGSVITRLGMRGDAFVTVLSGGVFRGIPSLVDKVARLVAEIAPRSDVRRLDVEPAAGAVTLALAAARGPVAIPSYV
jgi:N-acetylglucosamine kinase-like BadF-type ATPase